jgi:hypothetical protein
MNIHNIKRKHLLQAVEYCNKIFKKPTYPKLRLSRTRLKEEPSCKGEYDEDTNTLIIYKPAHRSAIDIIDTVIHEYTHSTQCMVKYFKMAGKHGYNKHPYEHEATRMGKLHSKKCKQYITELNKK